MFANNVKVEGCHLLTLLLQCVVGLLRSLVNLYRSSFKAQIVNSRQNTSKALFLEANLSHETTRHL